MIPLALCVVALILGFLLILAGKRTRRHSGLADARTLALDDRTLFSRRLMLAGRPDRILDGYISEEWKSAMRVYKSHIAQLATYFVLIEDVYGVRPPHGFIVTGDGERHLIENTAELREWALEVAEQIRAVRVRDARGQRGG
jgi:CRISPR-associated exonuclease Cas4